MSIPATDTRHVAEVLVEILGGELSGFGPYRASWIAWAADDVGAAIEVYPVGTELYPPAGPGQALFRHDAAASGFSATHAAVSVDLSAEQIVVIGEREGWRAERCSRGPHDVIELWIENRVMLELMTPEMTADYLAAAPRRS
jgi:hypothetical protein